MRGFLTAIALAALTAPSAAQWLNHPTPGIPRTADGKPNLSAPAPRTADGKPDFMGLWNGPTPAMRPDPRIVQGWATDVMRQRQEVFGKDSPRYQCRPSGFETMGGWTRILQTPMMIAVLNDDLTYRQIFMDGRALEADPFRTWMGYSVGRWEGDTLVVESFGFNDKTWLNSNGLPHTEGLRVTERYQRPDFGHLQIEVTVTDPAAYAEPWKFTARMELAADTEMVEGVCETGTDHWTGTISDTKRSAVSVAPEVLATYVGVYSGLYFNNMRTVQVTLVGGELQVDGRPLFAISETLFESAAGLAYEFVRDGAATSHVVEIHVSGNYPYARRR